MSRKRYTPRLPGPHQPVVKLSEVAIQTDGSVNHPDVPAAVRQHWVLVLCAWVLLMAVAIPPIWLLKKPSYTATAQIKVDPVLSSVLDRHMETIPLFDSYLASQALLITSGPVLERALQSPKLADLPAPDKPGLAGLRAKVIVAPVPRTQIIEIKATDTKPGTAIVLADAVLNAYFKQYGGTAEIDQKLDFLRQHENELKKLLDDLRQKRLKLAGEYKATTDTMFEKLRELEAKSSEQTRQSLESVDLEIMNLEQEIEQIKAGKPLEADFVDPEKQQAAVDANPVVQSLRAQIQAESASLLRLRRNLTDQTPEVIETIHQIDSLQKALEVQKVKAAQALRGDQLVQQAQIRDRQIALRQTKLDSARHLRERLAGRIGQQEANDRRMGEFNINIQAVQEEIVKLTKDLAQVEEARKSLEVERLQPGPGRVSKASAADILPDGYVDRRPKLTATVVFGALFLSVCLGLVRHRYDSRVRATTQVENSAGLRVLGAVPALADLKRGRVTQEEFAEAYRLVRVNVLSRALGEPPRSVLVTSSQASEGKTSLAVSLAISLAELGGKTLLVDGDGQVPQIGDLLGVDSPCKLGDVLAESKQLAEAVISSPLGQLDVLLGGLTSKGATIPLDQHNASRLIHEASKSYDYVVVDSSPALGSVDALIWSQVVDGVIISTRIGSSDVRATRCLCDRLAMVGARLLGAVVCNVPIKDGYAHYSYAYSSSRWSNGKKAASPIFCLPELNAKNRDPQQQAGSAADRS